MKTVQKPWGREEWVALNDRYCLKILHIKKGTRTSLQKHAQKRETLYVDSGKIRFLAGPDASQLSESLLGPGSVMEIVPGVVHRFEAVEECRLIEASTPEVDDVIRLQDDYQRPSGRIEAEHK